MHLEPVEEAMIPVMRTAMKTERRRRSTQKRVTAILWACLLVLVPALPAEEAPDGEVTATSGPSRLTSLGTPLARTSLGRIGLIGGGAGDGDSGDPGRWLRDGFEASGADLYRLNCRSCHGARGGGLPPEILPIINLVQETSSEFIKQQMAAQKQPVDSALAEKMAASARRNLRARLLHGGAKMIPFDHLAAEEFEALAGYLYQLAEIPQASAPTVHQPADRMGEHLVKGTCQICHDAIPSATAVRGPNPDIPSLARMTEDYSLAAFLRGAHHAGSGEGSGRGRGPKLSYLSDEELMAAYVYLAAYPPE